MPPQVKDSGLQFHPLMCEFRGQLAQYEHVVTGRVPHKRRRSPLSLAPDESLRCRDVARPVHTSGQSGQAQTEQISFAVPSITGRSMTLPRRPLCAIERTRSRGSALRAKHLLGASTRFVCRITTSTSTLHSSLGVCAPHLDERLETVSLRQGRKFLSTQDLGSHYAT